MICKVQFLPENRSIEVEAGTGLLDAALREGVMIDASCAGKGLCGKCKVYVQKGDAGPMTEAEKKALSDDEIADGCRLACQICIADDLSIFIPDVHGSSTRKKKMNKLPEGFSPDPAVQKTFFKLPKANLETQVNALTRIRESLDLPDMTILPRQLAAVQKAITAKRGKMTTVVYDGRLITAEADDTSTACFGMAFDIGTTTIVGILWNLTTGEMVDVEAATNPQSVFGSDVISRIQYCVEGENHTRQMQEKVIACCDQMAAELCARSGIEITAVYDITMVGNTTMSHLFAGINPESMSKIPFAPIFTESLLFEARDMGFHVNDAAMVYILPNIAGHVGSDITGVMLAADIFSLKGTTVALDVGTNGEILVARDGDVKACSTAAGPAFEGACIQCGMRAAKGAIERVHISNDVTIGVIEDVEPIGICGSGLIDAVAELIRTGLVGSNGNLLSPEEAAAAGYPEAIVDRLYGEGTNAGFVLSRKGKGGSIVITQKDIREVQLAKGAILGGILTLMKKLGITIDDLDRILIAGAFGSYIDKQSAIQMGLLPPVPVEKITSIGNAAGVGSSMALLSKKVRRQAEEQTRAIEHVELAQDEDFQDYYISGMQFPKP